MAAEDTRAATPTRTSVRRLGAGGQAGFRSGAGSPPLSPSPPSPASGPASSGETGAALPDPSQSSNTEERALGQGSRHPVAASASRISIREWSSRTAACRSRISSGGAGRNIHPASVSPPASVRQSASRSNNCSGPKRSRVHAQLRLSQFADPVEAAGKPLIVLERRTALRRSAAADRGRRSAGLVGVSFGVAVHPEGGAMVELGDAVHLLRPAPSPIVGEDEAGEDRRRHEQPPQRKKPGLPADERQRHRRRRHRQAGARDAAHLTDERRRLLHTIVGPAPELVVVGGRSGSHGAPRAERRPRAARNRS